MRWWALALGAGLLYALALVATAPATMLDAELQRASDGRLRLAEARGSLWSGTGQLEMRDARGRSGAARRITWRLRPGWLLLARIGYEIELDPAPRPFALTISWSHIEIDKAEINLPAAALGLGLPKLAPLELTGDMRLRISSLSIGRDATRGSASLRWRAAGSALTPVSPLGDYEVRLEGEGAVARLTLLTLKGPLQLDGQGSWLSGRRPAFRATAQVPPELRQRLAPFLRLIAVERGAGHFALQLN